MKRQLCLLIITAMILSLFAACGDPGTEIPNTDAGNQSSESTGEGSKPSQTPTGNGGETVQVGDVLDAPEKIASVEDLEALTFTTSFSMPLNGMERTIVYAVARDGDKVRFYEASTTKIAETPDLMYMEQICLPGGDGMLAYSRPAVYGDYTPMNWTNDFGSNDGYFRYNLAFFGLDYQDWFTADGFTKREDESCLGKDCFVYAVTFSSKLAEGNTDAVIYVDKQTGLWLKTEMNVDGNTLTRAIDSIEYNASVFPGSQAVDMVEQEIYNHGGIVITAKALDFSDPNGAVLHLQTTNSTGSDVKFTSHYFDINGLCLGGSVLSDTCPAGGTKETALTLPNSALDLSCIDIIQNIEFALRLENVHTESTPDGTFTVTDSVLVEKTQALTIKTQCPGDYIQAVNKEGIVLIDTADLYLVLCSFEVDAIGQGVLTAYCENRLGEPIRATINIKTINGIAYDDFDKISMQENSEGFDCFTIWSSTLKDMGIDRITSVELTHEVFSGESFANSQRVTEESEIIRISFD